MGSQRIFGLPAPASTVNRGKQGKQDREACRRAGIRQVGTVAPSVTPQNRETFMAMAGKTGESKTQAKAGLGQNLKRWK